MQPLSGKVAHEIVGEHPANLFLEIYRLAEFTIGRRGEQFVIGNTAPQKK